MRLPSIIRFSLLLLALAAAVPAQTTAAPTASRAQVVSELRRILREAEGQGITVGLMVASAEGGAAIAVRRQWEPLIPASNMKIFTAGAALLALGPDHVIRTDLIAHGEIRDGRLAGSLRLRGEGDPTLRSSGEGGVIARWVAAVRGAKIRRVAGDLLVDDRAFDREFTGPGWPEASPTRKWMAEVAALSLDHGTVEVAVSAGTGVGARAPVELRPAGTGIRVNNRLTTCRSRREHVVDIQRRRDQNRLQLRGKVVLGTRRQGFEVAVHDLPGIVGASLRHALIAAGVEIEGVVRRPRPGECTHGGRLLLRVQTPITEVLPLLLKSSHNHRAEMLLKHLGAVKGEGGSFAGGSAAVVETLESVAIDPESGRFVDGSGLSRQNRLSAGLTVALLRALWRSSVGKELRAALPAGGEGTLQRRLKELGPRVRAKTGTLNRVSALSGFVETAAGESLAFSILMNSDGAASSTMRRLQDRVVRTLSRLEKSE